MRTIISLQYFEIVKTLIKKSILSDDFNDDGSANWE